MGFVNPSARPAASNNNVPILFIVAAVILIIVVVFLACIVHRYHWTDDVPRTATEMRPRGGERMSKWFV